MNIWRFKALIAALAVTLTAGCDEATTAGLIGSATSTPRQQASLAGGAITLVAPAGYCVDRTALRPQFALLARCDTLGAGVGDSAAPVGVISVSVTPADVAQTLPSPQQIATASGLGKPRNASVSKELTLFRATGPAPAEGMSETQWRAAARVGDHLLGVTLYGPEGGRAVSSRGADLINALVTRTRASSGAQ